MAKHKSGKLLCPATALIVYAKCCFSHDASEIISQGETEFFMSTSRLFALINEPPRGKTNNVVSEQVRHKPACTSTEKS